MTKILKDFRVVEMGTYITGPAAGMLLADLGADVIKVEKPETGDPFRAFKGGLYSPHFQTYNRNKRSIALDLQNPVDRDQALELVKQADVLVQNFKFGGMQKMGLGYEQLRAINPRLIYCSITGYGQTGPQAQRAGHDLNYLAEAGILGLTRGADGAPVLPPVLAADIAGGA